MIDFEPTLRGSLRGWTETGIDCHRSGADCASCTVFHTTGRHKGHRDPRFKCHQPESNELLFSKGLQPPEPDTFAKPIEFKEKPKRPRGFSAEGVGILLREQIVLIVQTRGQALSAEITADLNAINFLNHQWEQYMIWGHLKRLKKFGVLEMAGTASGRRHILKVGNPDNLQSMICDRSKTRGKAFRVNLERRA